MAKKAVLEAEFGEDHELESVLKELNWSCDDAWRISIYGY